MRTSKRLTAAQIGLNAVVAASTDSVAIDTKYAYAVAIMVTRGAHTSGSSTFSVKGSIDGGLTYVPLKTLFDNVVGVAGTHVANKVLSANGTDIVWLDLSYSGLPINNIIITAAVATDGNASAYVYIERPDEN